MRRAGSAAGARRLLGAQRRAGPGAPPAGLVHGATPRRAGAPPGAPRHRRRAGLQRDHGGPGGARALQPVAVRPGAVPAAGRRCAAGAERAEGQGGR